MSAEKQNRVYKERLVLAGAAMLMLGASSLAGCSASTAAYNPQADKPRSFAEQPSLTPEGNVTQKQPQKTPQPGGGLAWNEAAAHVGEVQRVCGPLVTVRNSTDDVFLNVGRDYPSKSRFTIVLWDIGGIEPIASGVTVCTTGLITSYQGIAQIELRDASAVEIWN